MKLKITIDGKSYEAEVEILEEDETAGAQIPAYPPVPLAAPPSPVMECCNEDACLSPVMGLVIRVNVRPGQKVAAGESVIVLEAMKMETNLTAQRSAVVRAINVKPGDSVRIGQVLVEFE